MGASKLFAGLNAPQPLKLDTQPLDAFLAKLLEAVKSTDAELQTLREENAALRSEVGSLRSTMQKSDNELLRSDIAMLKEKVVILEGKMYNAENKIQNKAEASTMQVASSLSGYVFVVKSSEVTYFVWLCRKSKRQQMLLRAA